jgi:hypothetical protein
MSKEVSPKFFTRAQLQKRWGVSFMFIERLGKRDPNFPKPIRLADGKMARRYWQIDAIEAWERDRIAKSA